MLLHMDIVIPHVAWLYQVIPSFTVSHIHLSVYYLRQCPFRITRTDIKHKHSCVLVWHYSDVIMGAIESQITSLTIVYSIVFFGRRSQKTSKLRVTDLCVGNSPVTGEFSAQRASNAENASIWWRHHGMERYHFMRGQCTGRCKPPDGSM